jgi:hypothetical protein
VLLEIPNLKLTQRLLKMSLLRNEHMDKSYIAIGRTFIMMGAVRVEWG